MQNQPTFIQLARSKDTMELIKEQDAFILLSVIAIRARRTDAFNIYDLKPREALIGDYKNYGMTERRYRTSKDKLVKWGFITIKATSKGTIATLLDNGIYDINLEVKDGQATTKRRTTDERPTTNNNDNNANNEKKKYMEFVKLTDVEYGKLVEKFGKEITQDWIETLSNGIGSKGYKYKSHYHTILTWARKKEKQHQPEVASDTGVHWMTEDELDKLDPSIFKSGTKGLGDHDKYRTKKTE